MFLSYSTTITIATTVVWLTILEVCNTDSTHPRQKNGVRLEAEGFVLRLVRELGRQDAVHRPLRKRKKNTHTKMHENTENTHLTNYKRRPADFEPDPGLGRLGKG